MSLFLLLWSRIGSGCGVDGHGRRCHTVCSVRRHIFTRRRAIFSLLVCFRGCCCACSIQCLVGTVAALPLFATVIGGTLFLLMKSLFFPCQNDRFHLFFFCLFLIFGELCVRLINGLLDMLDTPKSETPSLRRKTSAIENSQENPQK